MAFQLKNKADNSILHESPMSEKDFNTPALQGEWMHMKHEFGEVKMKNWIFDGMRMGYSDSVFLKPITLDWQGDLQVITMYYSLKGSVSIGSRNGHVVEIGNNQQNMHFGTEAAGSMKVDDLRIRSFMVQFNKEAFLRIAGGGTDALKLFADQVAGNKSAVFSANNLPIDIPTQQAIDAIMHCKYSDSLKRIFFLSKAMELMVLQAEAHARSLSQPSSHLKSDYDRERIIYARDYLLQHIDAPPTIPELAKIAGINEFKLKKGYKETFGSTIFGHLAEARLELSKAALQEGKKPISDIAFELGYSSTQHFSAAFKKRYGISPRQQK